MRKAIIRFIGENSEILLDKKLIALPLKEDFVINKSIEFFNDPEPCMIHRSAVMKRTYMEFFDYFNQLKGQGKDQVFWDELPVSIKESLNICNKPYIVEFYLI